MVQKWGDKQSKSGQRICRGAGGRNCLRTSPSFTLQGGGNTGRGSPPSGTTLTEALVGRAKVPVPLQESSGNLDIRRLSKSLQSCPTLCDTIDGSLLGSPVPGILQARTLEWVAISFSNA